MLGRVAVRGAVITLTAGTFTVTCLGINSYAKKAQINVIVILTDCLALYSKCQIY